MSEDSIAKTIITSGGVKKEYDKGTLSFLDADREIRIFNATEIIIGREPVCDVFVDNARISRKHAVVQLEYGGAKFIDLASSNGSTRNDEKVQGTIILNDGDKLVLGGTLELGVKIREEGDAVKSVSLKMGRTEFLLTHSDVLIGRNPAATDVTVTNDPLMATIHAQIEFMYTQAIISALDDEKPIVIDGKPTKSFELKNYSGVLIGGTRLTWRY